MRASLSTGLTRTIAGVFVTVIRAFLNDVFGRSSIVLAALALWRRSPAAAYPAVAIGTWGMMLYTFTWRRARAQRRSSSRR